MSSITNQKMPKKSFIDNNDHFKTNSVVENGISLYIPRVFNNIGVNRVRAAFIKQNWGFVERVDLVHYGDHKKAFIHFRAGSWNWNTRNAQILEQLQRGEQIHLLYENGQKLFEKHRRTWFWHVGISSTARLDKEDVNYFPTIAVNLKNDTQGDELLKRKRENRLAKEVAEEARDVVETVVCCMEEGKLHRVGDDPIMARMNEGSPKALTPMW